MRIPFTGGITGVSLAEFLRTVNSYFLSSDFAVLWKVVVGLGAIFTLLAIIASFGDYRQSIRLLKFFGVVILVWYLGNVVKVRVDVADKCTGEVFEDIEVPWAIGKAVSYATTLERNIREGLVKFFGSSLPDSYKNHEGCFTGYELLKPALVYSPRDPYLRLSIREYIKNCFIPSVLAGDVDRTTIENSRDLWNDVFPCSLGQVCQSLTTTYYSSAHPQGIVDTCPNVYARIDADLVREYDRAWKVIKAQVFGTGSSVLESDIPVYLGETSAFLMAVGLTGENLIRQAIAIQTLNQVSAEFATAVAYQEAYLSALARINMLDFGRGGTLNAMKGVIQVILVGLTPAFFVLFVTPLGWMVFRGWITFFVWLIVWSIAEVITVSLLYLYLGRNYRFDFVLSDIDRLVFTFNKAAQISSLMSDWIPLIALAVTTGSIYTLTQFAKGVSSDLRDQHGAKVMASGNFDAGNIRVDTYSQATRAIANSTRGGVSQDTYQGRVFSGDIFNYGNETIGQSQIYDPLQGELQRSKRGNGTISGSGRRRSFQRKREVGAAGQRMEACEWNRTGKNPAGSFHDNGGTNSRSYERHRKHERRQRCLRPRNGCKHWSNRNLHEE
ncbi:MAG: conjugal transfer protein TraG N-terminal domain-containing protein [Aquificota bacterium]|nr:conjugal transfer protein TraG N-terminal domain-containing protein [Aquificota bacterium]